MIYAYVRVSTGKQNLENQQLEVSLPAQPPPAFRVSDWAKSRVFPLSAPQIGRKIEFSLNPRVRFGKKSSFPAFRTSD